MNHVSTNVVRMNMIELNAVHANFSGITDSKFTPYGLLDSDGYLLLDSEGYELLSKN